MTFNKNSPTDGTSGSRIGGIPNGKRNSAPNSSKSHATPALRELMDSLPQELHEQIYDLTFAAEAKIRAYNFDESCGPTPARLRDATKYYSKQVVTVNERPPHLLHVDRASRQKFAKSYYGNPNSVFLFPTGCSFSARKNPFLSLMKDVRLITWHDLAILNSYRRAHFAEWAKLSAESIDLVFYKDIPALVNKLIGGVEKAVGNPAPVSIDLTI